MDMSDQFQLAHLMQSCTRTAEILGMRGQKGCKIQRLRATAAVYTIS